MSWGGIESEPMSNPREKSPLPENFSPEEDRIRTLHYTGHRAQHTTNELFRNPKGRPLVTNSSSAKLTAYELCLFVGCLTSQGRICTDNFTCCHTEIEAADQTFHLTQSQYTDTGPTSPSADPITPGAWQGIHWSANV